MGLRETIKNAKNAYKRFGKSIICQLFEMIYLRISSSKLGADDYYLYHLYDDRQYSFEEKKEFIGWRQSIKLDQKLNKNQWHIYANDKIEFAKAMNAAGIRTPDIIAFYTEGSKQLEGGVLLHNHEDVIHFLSNPNVYPLFIKPVNGTYGKGCFSALSFDNDTSLIAIGDGSYRSLDEVAEQLSEKRMNGFIFQKLLFPHPKVEAVIGTRLSTIRIIVLLTDNGPQLFRATWKLPTDSNMSDNFMHGELGNLIANVNIKTGKVTNTVGMSDGEMVVFAEHPNTKVSLIDLSVPLWTEIVDFCKEAAPVFSGLAMQHWDIAICAEGPVALEVNVEGSMDLHQLAGFSGVYDATLRALEKTYE